MWYSVMTSEWLPRLEKSWQTAAMWPLTARDSEILALKLRSYVLVEYMHAVQKIVINVYMHVVT